MTTHEHDNIDDVVQQMAEDDRHGGGDLYSELGLLREFLTPRNYALRRGLLPQQVYYYIRRGIVPGYKCLCGGTVVDIYEADKLLAEHKGERSGNISSSQDETS